MSVTEKEKVIFEIQQYLRNIAKSQSDAPAIIPDGIFSEETRQQVKKFQESVGLKVTGTVDYATFSALVKENERVSFQFSEPVQVTAIGNEDLPLSYGDENRFVEVLKTMLNFVAQSYGNFNALERNAIFDRDTEREVKRWQSVIFVEENGRVDKLTWNTLADFYLIR